LARSKPKPEQCHSITVTDVTGGVKAFERTVDSESWHNGAVAFTRRFVDRAGGGLTTRRRLATCPTSVKMER
jgi:hypothetical protein